MSLWGALLTWSGPIYLADLPALIAATVAKVPDGIFVGERASQFKTTGQRADSRLWSHRLPQTLNGLGTEIFKVHRRRQSLKGIAVLAFAKTEKTAGIHDCSSINAVNHNADQMKKFLGCSAHFSSIE